MAFSLPNTILNGQSGDATAVQQNFDYLLSSLNTSAILKDGSVAMDQPLALAGDPVSALQAAPKQYVDNATPLGSVIMYGGTTAPSSQWLLCRGQEVSRSTYAGLFAVVGTAFGVGNGTTTFNVPDARGRVPMGYNQGGAYFAVGVGETFGSKDAVLPSHVHGISFNSGGQSLNHSHTGTTGTESADHSHGLRGNATTSVAGGFGEGNVADILNTDFANAFNTGGKSATHTHNFTTSAASVDHSHAINGSTQATGDSAVNANLPPSLSFNMIIKAL